MHIFFLKFCKTLSYVLLIELTNGLGPARVKAPHRPVQQIRPAQAQAWTGPLVNIHFLTMLSPAQARPVSKYPFFKKNISKIILSDYSEISSSSRL